ncbi:MAG: CpsB/CapC family capsule biosynthesis tyrosine phosphatase [Gemmataceae bacterium]
MMVPLADTHVHLLAGKDDGPATLEEAVAMCRMLVSEGVRAAAGLAHQNHGYPENTPQALRDAAKELSATLKAEKIPLTIYPSAETMASPDLVEKWVAGQWLSIGDRKKFLLVEMPHGMFLDLRPAAMAFKPLGIRIIVAHAERYPELLHDRGLCEEWIRLGCLIQVTGRGLSKPPSGKDEAALKDWVKRGLVHLLGSDGHNLNTRQPRLKDGYATLVRWAGMAAADRIGGIWGNAVLQGLPVMTPLPQKPKTSWFSNLFGR